MKKEIHIFVFKHGWKSVAYRMIVRRGNKFFVYDYFDLKKHIRKRLTEKTYLALFKLINHVERVGYEVQSEEVGLKLIKYFQNPESGWHEI